MARMLNSSSACSHHMGRFHARVPSFFSSQALTARRYKLIGTQSESRISEQLTFGRLWNFKVVVDVLYHVDTVCRTYIICDISAGLRYGDFI